MRPIQPDPRYFNFGGAFQGGMQRAQENTRRNALLDIEQQQVGMQQQRVDAAMQDRAAQQKQYSREQKTEALTKALGVYAANPQAFGEEQLGAIRQGLDELIMPGAGQGLSPETAPQYLSVFGGGGAAQSDRLYEFLDPKTGKPVYGRADQASGNSPFVKQTPDSRPSSVEEYEYWRNLPPEEQQRMLEVKRANANPGVIYDNTRAKKEGEEDAEFISSFPKIKRSYESSIGGYNNTLKNISEARRLANGWTVGFMSNIGKFRAGTPQYDLQRKLEPILAAIGFDKLQNMRENSPTGGALGQVSERELTYLQSTIASLDAAQSPEQFAQALSSVEDAYKRYRESAQRALREDDARYKKLRVRGGRQEPESSPAQDNGPTVVRTGTLNGKKVVQYSDGSVEYAP